MSFRLCLHFTLPTSLFTLRFGPLSHLTNVRQPALSHIWERAGGEGRQRRRRLSSVAHAHPSTELSLSGGRGSRWSVVSGEFPALSSFHSSHLTLHSSLWLPLPPDQCEATSPATHLGEGGGEGRQRRRLGSVAPLHTSTGLSLSGELGSVELTPPRHCEESSTKQSRGFL